MEEFLNLYNIILDTEKDFNGLPIFVRPFIKGEFESKTTLTLEQWKSAVREINKIYENYDDGKQQLLKDKLNFIKPRLERLIVYIDGIPDMAKKFIKSATELEQIKRISASRKQVVIKAIEKAKI